MFDLCIIRGGSKLFSFTHSNMDILINQMSTIAWIWFEFHASQEPWRGVSWSQPWLKSACRFSWENPWTIEVHHRWVTASIHQCQLMFLSRVCPRRRWEWLRTAVLSVHCVGQVLDDVFSINMPLVQQLLKMIPVILWKLLQQMSCFSTKFYIQCKWELPCILIC